MKKVKIAYWIVTILFAAFMLFSAIPDLMYSKQAADFMTNLHYSEAFTRFIGFAKILGVIGILVPGFPRIKEWAYAGLAFDLIGATYSIIVVGTPFANWVFMLVFIIVLFVSYGLYHAKQKATGAAHV
jgi:hypothetical protein